MPEKIEAYINYKILVWARNSIGLNIEAAARKIGVKPAKLLQWEEGTHKPTIKQLRTIASVYKRPIAIFYLAEEPRTFDAMKDFRRIAGVEKQMESPMLLYEIRKAYYRRDVALELSRLLEEEIPTMPHKISRDGKIDNIADYVREIIGVDVERQKSCDNKYEALKMWKRSIESSGVFIFHTSHTSKIPLREMRGFALCEKQLPVIVLNSRDSARGKMFTLLHEYVHILLNNGGICNLIETDSPRLDEEQTETFCNYVAGAILVPTRDLLKHAYLISNHKDSDWSDNVIKELADIYWVSNEVILRKLLILGKMSNEYYLKKRKEYIKAYENYAQRKSKGFASYKRLLMASNGFNYLSLIMNAMNHNAITLNEATDYIVGAKVKHIDSIEKDLLAMR